MVFDFQSNQNRLNDPKGNKNIICSLVKVTYHNVELQNAKCVNIYWIKLCLGKYADVKMRVIHVKLSIMATKSVLAFLFN